MPRCWSTTPSSARSGSSRCAHGADIVLYSATKFIGGHSDVIAGAALGSKAMMAPMRGLRTFLGSMLSPMDGWLLMRSLETLKMRMTAAMKNARHVARFLKSHPKVARVALPRRDARRPSDARRL